MNIAVEFLEMVLKRHETPQCTIHITDAEARIMVSSQHYREGTPSKTAMYVIQIGRPTVIDSQPETGNNQSYCTPVFVDEVLQGSVVVKGPEQQITVLGNTIKYSLETALEYERHTQQDFSALNERTHLAKQLLQQNSDPDKLLSTMNRLELDPSLLRCVIYIEMEFHQTKYFSINLNLGYQSSIEKIRQEILDIVKNNQFLNAEDLVVNHTNNSIVVIKSFIPVKDLSRIYLSLDVICQSYVEALKKQPAFSFHIAYGNLHYGPKSVAKSLQEAIDTLHIGKISKQKSQFYNLESVLLESICHNLQPQIVNKLLEPALQKLREADPSGYTSLLDCAEVFMDTEFNIAKTAQILQVHRNTVLSRLNRLAQITSINPMQGFQEAFLVKLIAIYRNITGGTIQSSK